MSQHLFSLTLSKPIIFDGEEIKKIWFDSFTGKHMRKIRMSTGGDGDDDSGPSVEVGSLMKAGELALADNMGKIKASFVLDNMEPADIMALCTFVGERMGGGQPTGKTALPSSPEISDSAATN